MSGSGGHKHRVRQRAAKRGQMLLKARENIRRIRHSFEERGQGWDPLGNPQQLAALNHAARHLLQQPVRV